MINDVSELVATVRALMEPYSGSWALAGGWALDSWLGKITREHDDLDIAVFMDEQRLVYEQLLDWRLVAHETEDADHQILWDGHGLAPAAHLHASTDIGPRRELLVNERNMDDRGEGTWILRRLNGATASLPLGRFALISPWGLPTLAPEALGFYKQTSESRPRDLQDMELLGPLLDDAQRAWLARHRPQ